MTTSRHFDTVAFDVRDEAAMLFFAETQENGDIGGYILLMRAINADFDDTLYIEVDDQQLSGSELLTEAEIDGNLLRLSLAGEAAKAFGGEDFVITFDDTERNHAGIRAGALRVLGDKLVVGHG